MGNQTNQTENKYTTQTKDGTFQYNIKKNPLLKKRKEFTRRPREGLEDCNPSRQR